MSKTQMYDGMRFELRDSAEETHRGNGRRWRQTLLALVLFQPILALAQQPVVWRFDNLTEIHGVPPTILGSPKIVDTELGKAIHFEGKADSGDALFLDALPLAGTLPYTLEVIFRPSSKGAQAQRFFHLQEAASKARRMFELRIVQDKWCLDTVAFSYPAGEPPRSGVLLNCDVQHLFPLDRWYAIAAVYDGKILRAYVDGELQGEIAVNLLPLGTGGTSAGTRYTRQDYFTGDIFSARFTPRALPIDHLQQVPLQQRAP